MTRTDCVATRYLDLEHQWLAASVLELTNAFKHNAIMLGIIAW